MSASPTDPGVAYLTPEAKARVEIDRMLAAAGWEVQDYARVNLSAARGARRRGARVCAQGSGVEGAFADERLRVDRQPRLAFGAQDVSTMEILRTTTSSPCVGTSS